MLATSDIIKTGGIDKNNDRRIIGTQTAYILEDDILWVILK